MFFPNANGNAAPWQPEPPPAAVGEDVGELDPEPGLLHAEGAEDEDEEPVFVLTDEWAEFFAKSDAKRRLGNSSSHHRRLCRSFRLIFPLQLPMGAINFLISWCFT